MVVAAFVVREPIGTVKLAGAAAILGGVGLTGL